MCGGNCLIACSDEIERDRTAVLGEDRQSPVIAAKTRTYREFNAHVFHRPAKENPDLTELERSGQGKLTEMVRGVVPAILPNGRHKRGELEAGATAVCSPNGGGACWPSQKIKRYTVSPPLEV